MRNYVQETREAADRSIEYSRRAIEAAKLGTMAGVTARLKGSLGAEKNKEDYKCSVN